MGKRKRSRSSSSEDSDGKWMRRKMRLFQEEMEDRLRKRKYEDRRSKMPSREKYRGRSSSRDSYSYRYPDQKTDSESQTVYTDEYSDDENNKFKEVEINDNQVQSGSSASNHNARGNEISQNTDTNKVANKEQISTFDKNPESGKISESANTINSLSIEELKVIGSRIDPERVLAPEANEDLAVRISEIIKKGLPREEKKILMVKFPPPKNCLFLDPPKLNAAVKAALQDPVIKRDLRIVDTQQKITASLGGLMNLASFAFTLDNEKKLEMLGIVSSVLRIIADLQFDQSSIRRNLILKNIDGSMRETLNSTQVGEWLFGENLEEQVKATKVLATSSGALKMKKPNNSPKNLRGPARRQPPRRQFPQTGQKFSSRGQKTSYNDPMKKKKFNKERN
ncbi:uncharacterized protein LOC122512464 isoform X2 [Leptopilina heterotoma]|uniref:uncharacterized protein LOC122510523 isoform X2 n=1 Tax=Leptopilina heterotoma TaxID=63436 RepID=UPI001CA94CB4|nr:uncharacterized protein LOC122510523 isoform X2 [Leptopilina heterotoma]XP_043484239.1 uncharacterized protein LOC122512464 isoform X2 [Leptopilina heterotoma]